MNYPQWIYEEFEIVEKDIGGQKHYGLLRVKSFLGITYKRHVKMCFIDRSSAYEGDYYAVRWLPYRLAVQSIINSARLSAEWAYERRMRK